MSPAKQEEIRRSLRQLAEIHAATIALLERTFSQLCDEQFLDPAAHWRATRTESSSTSLHGLTIDESLLTVTFQGRTCYLGNTLSFRLLARLARRPNVFVSHQSLLRDVWQGARSADAIRSVVKTLRAKLRQAGLEQLSAAIDGTARGHYVLRLTGS